MKEEVVTKEIITTTREAMLRIIQDPEVEVQLILHPQTIEENPKAGKEEELTLPSTGLSSNRIEMKT